MQLSPVQASLLATISAGLGIVAVALAGWGASRAVDVFPLQAACAVLALGLGITSRFLGDEAAHWSALANVLAAVGIVLGAVWLGAMALLYVLWPT